MSTIDTSKFDAIRPYNKGEMKQALNDLLGDRHFQAIMKGYMPWLPKSVKNGVIRMLFIGIDSPLDFQRRFMFRIVKHLIRKASTGFDFDHLNIQKGSARYSFLSNHRDIVLDSALLDVALIQHEFENTVEIGIGDNLLIYPWIKAIVRMNKAFTVRRGLSPRELLASSQLMSEYMHYAITQKKENIWLAQREGRAKDSNDRTQDAVLKMLAMGGEGTPIERLKELNIVPLTISYEYDPCDYLKAKEFQQKRDDPKFKKSKQDDLDNMRIGIFGKKGRIMYRAAAPINTWIDELKDVPRTELFTAIAQRMDKAIHQGYELYPGNYVAYDMLHGEERFVSKYTDKEKQTFEQYLQSRIDLVDLPNKDVPFLRERILTMYAFPVQNKEAAKQ